MRKRNHFNAWLILFVCSVFIILRLPSLFEPHWYADEGIYQVVGRAINDGRILYQGIWDNKPPVLYLIYAIFNGNLFFIKLYSLLVGVTSVIVFYFLSIKLFKKNWSIYISIGVYTILFASPIIEGNIANAENFMILPIVTSAFLIFKYLDGNKIKNLIASGFFLSIAFATKTVAVFDFFAFFFIFIFNTKGRQKTIY